MAAPSPLLRVLGIAASTLASFEAVAWGVMAFLAILTSTEVIVPTLSELRSELLKKHLAEYLVTEQVTVLILMSLYLGTSILWLIVSGLVINDFLKDRFTRCSHISWVIVTFAVCILDLAATIVFGLEYGRRIDILDGNTSALIPLEATLAPAIMMVLSARGFVLWLLNLAGALYLLMAAYTMQNHPVKESSRPVSRDEGSLYGDFTGRTNPAFQPDSLSAWNIQSPVVGDMKRAPWGFPETTSPVKFFPVRVAKPVSPPIVPVSPLPIPQPDYSPPLGRPIKHVPNLYDTPTKSVLKKPTRLGRTML